MGSVVLNSHQVSSSDQKTESFKTYVRIIKINEIDTVSTYIKHLLLNQVFSYKYIKLKGQSCLHLEDYI